MLDSDLRHQVKNIIRALKPNGNFFIQFAGSYDTELNDNREGLDKNYGWMTCGHMCRTKEYSQSLVEDCGGKVVEVGGDKDWRPQHNSYWYWFRVQKA